MTDVNRIAKLAKLSLNAEEEQEMASHFARMLEYVSRLDELNLEKIRPLPSPHETVGRLREDEPGTSLERDKVLEEAPDSFHSYFRVPSPLKDVEKA